MNFKEFIKRAHADLDAFEENWGNEGRGDIDTETEAEWWADFIYYLYGTDPQIDVQAALAKDDAEDKAEQAKDDPPWEIEETEADEPHRNQGDYGSN